MASDPDDLDAWLIGAETAIAERDPSWPGGVASLLDDAFREIGASGRSWDRQSVEVILADPPTPGLIIDEARVDRLDATVALLTYRTVEPTRTARRVSIWVRTEAGWRLRYHQGTIIPPA